MPDACDTPSRTVGPAGQQWDIRLPRAGYDTRVYPTVRTPFCRVVVIALSALLAVSGCVTAPDNAAKRSMKPFLAGHGSIHSKPICDCGDNGYGTDNDIPW